jgi:hypothetical protein
MLRLLKMHYGDTTPRRARRPPQPGGGCATAAKQRCRPLRGGMSGRRPSVNLPATGAKGRHSAGHH